jgi:multiple sugar transport system substrate-binding protein
VGRGCGRKGSLLLLHAQAMKGIGNRRLLNRRDFLAGLAGAALLGVAGCTSEESEGLARIVFSHGEDSEILRDQIRRFNEHNRGTIEVALRLAPADSSQYFEKLRIEFQAGQADSDVISGEVIWPAQFAANGWISDLSGLFTADLREPYLPAAIDSNTYEGAVYGVPWFTDAGMLYYRKDLLEQAGFSEPPKTWAEMQEMVEKVRRETGTRYVFVFQGADYEGGVVNSLEFIWSSGGNVLDPHDPDDVTVAAPEAVAGLETARGGLFALACGAGTHRGSDAPCRAAGEHLPQRPRRMEPHDQRRLREDGGRVGLYPLPERSRTAERASLERRLPAHARRLL